MPIDYGSASFRAGLADGESQACAARASATDAAQMSAVAMAAAAVKAREANKWSAWSAEFAKRLSGEMKARNALRNALAEVVPTHPLVLNKNREYEEAFNAGYDEEEAAQKTGGGLLAEANK